jgi:hypothetical protein
MRNHPELTPHFSPTSVNTNLSTMQSNVAKCQLKPLGSSLELSTPRKAYENQDDAEVIIGKIAGFGRIAAECLVRIFHPP